eukprot:754856-Hanusia_phi.AAC.7
MSASESTACQQIKDNEAQVDSTFAEQRQEPSDARKEDQGMHGRGEQKATRESCSHVKVKLGCERG